MLKLRWSGVDFRALHYFVGIAEIGSITRAAQHLNVAQPALSRHVRQLEEELGAQLFIRESRGIRMTDQGRELYEHAKSILRNVQRAKDDVRGSAGNPGGNTTLGVVPTICPLIAPKLVSSLQSDYPRINLKIDEGYSQPLIDWLDAGRLDLALVTEPPPTRRLFIEHLVSEEMVFATARGSRPKGAIPIAELAKTPLILSHGIRTILDNLLGHKGPLVTALLELNSIETIRLMVRQGIGTTVLPRSILHDEAKTGQISLHSIGPSGLFRRLAIAYSRTRRLSNASEIVKGLLMNIVATQDKQRMFRAPSKVK